MNRDRPFDIQRLDTSFLFIIHCSTTKRKALKLKLKLKLQNETKIDKLLHQFSLLLSSYFKSIKDVLKFFFG